MNPLVYFTEKARRSARLAIVTALSACAVHFQKAVRWRCSGAQCAPPDKRRTAKTSPATPKSSTAAVTYAGKDNVLRRRAIAMHGLFVVLLALTAPKIVLADHLPTDEGWHEYPGTTLQSVCPPNNFGGVTYDFAFYCRYVTAAWSGGALDTRRNRLYMWGGGHHDYYGNELYAFDLNALQMLRLTDPATPLADPYVIPPPSELSPFDGTQPNARHTYDGMEYMPNADRVWAFSGSLAGVGYSDNRTWIYDPNTNAWRGVSPAGSIPLGNVAIVSAYDPETGKIFLHDRDGFYSYEYDAAGGRYTQLKRDGYLDITMTAVIDPVRRKFIIIGDGKQYFYDIGPQSTYTRQILATTGATEAVNLHAPGLAYDSKRDKIVAWGGGDRIYTLDLQTREWHATDFAGGPAATQNGTYGRWQYVPNLDLFVSYNTYNTNAFTLRVTAAGGTSPDADWVARSTGPGVVRAIRFDTETEVTQYLYPEPRAQYASWDTSVKASGNGSLRFEIPPLSPANTSGQWRINFSDDLQTQFGENQEFYIQWRQRFDSYLIDHKYQLLQGLGGWKQAIIGQGDGVALQPGYEPWDGWPEVNSCTEMHLVVQNFWQQRFPSMYHGCWVYEQLEDYLPAIPDYTHQNAMQNCLHYGDKSGCFYYYPNEWMTFQVHVKLGPWSPSARDANTGTYRAGFTDSTVEFWVAREGEPAVLVHRETGLVLRRGNYSDDWYNSAHDGRYGKLWLLPYHTYKDPTENHLTSYTWYDEVIISTQRIPDPGVTAAPLPTMSLTADPTSVMYLGTSTLTWSSSNAISCTASGAWSGDRGTSGSEITAQLSVDSTFNLSCANADGATASASVAVTVAPVPVPMVDVTANPLEVPLNGSTTVSWTSSGATSCTASGDWTGAKAAVGSETVGPLTAHATFILTCVNEIFGTSASDSIVVTILPLPELTFTAEPASVPYLGTTALSWMSQNTKSCEASGAWSGVKSTLGNETVGPLTATSTFTLTCINGSTVSSSVTVTVAPAPVIQVNLDANPTSVPYLGTSTLTWTSIGATTCTASGAWRGTKPTSGSQLIGPLRKSRTYTLTCTNAAGARASDSVRVTVIRTTSDD